MKGLETAAVVGLAWFAGALAVAKVPGPLGFVAGAATLAGGEYYRRKQGLGIAEVSTGMAGFVWQNAIAASASASGELESVVPVYANVAEKARTFVDHGVERPELSLADWVSNTSSLRSLIIAGLPGEGKTYTAKALIYECLKAFPERYLKICTLDRGLSHDDTAAETWLGLSDDFFAESADDIRIEIESAEAEMENRYLRAKHGESVAKSPYIVFVDELVATMGMLKTGSAEYDRAFDKTLKNLLVRGPKARVWLMGATQMLDCNGTGMSQAVLKLFEFLVFPQLGASATSWRNLPDVAEQSSIIAELQKAPSRFPKPVAVLRAGRGSVVTMPRLEVPDYVPIVGRDLDPIADWLSTQSESMAAAAQHGLSATKAWDKIDRPKGAKAKANNNPYWVAFREAYGQMTNSQNGNQDFEPGRTDEDS